LAQHPTGTAHVPTLFAIEYRAASRARGSIVSQRDLTTSRAGAGPRGLSSNGRAGFVPTGDLRCRAYWLVVRAHQAPRSDHAACRRPVVLGLGAAHLKKARRGYPSGSRGGRRLGASGRRRLCPQPVRLRIGQPVPFNECMRMPDGQGVV